MAFRRISTPVAQTPTQEPGAGASPTLASHAPALLTVDAAAALAGVSRRTIYNWIAKGLVQTKTLASGRQRVVTASLFKGAA